MISSYLHFKTFSGAGGHTVGTTNGWNAGPARVMTAVLQALPAFQLGHPTHPTGTNKLFHGHGRMTPILTAVPTWPKWSRYLLKVSIVDLFCSGT